MGQAYVAFGAALVASTVEAVEALTVVLAVGLIRGFRSALLGAGVAFVLLVALVATIGGVVITRVPRSLLELVVGILILVFGLRWLRKAVLRAAGVKAMHDEARTFAETEVRLRGGTAGAGIDREGFVTSFQAVLLEGFEVAFIVVAAGAGGRALGAAALGGGVAVVGVGALGFALRKPLTRVPENTLKYGVAVALVSLGTYWAADGAGVRWPLDFLSVVPLALLCVAASWTAVLLIRRGQVAARHDPAA